ncbi:nucleotide exchange factor GrpE [Candidatus Peregrinibacteria bacterium]|nr:nucleotide exchange factor GrpE [Candidatus Peregrinibacteria bacterium]
MTKDNKNSKSDVAAPQVDEAAKLKEELAAKDKQIADLTDTAKRALADLQNFRRQAEKDRAHFVAFANAGLVLELLPILDNFARAFARVPEEVQKTNWFKGALQIEQQLVGIMKKQGVTEMPSSVGKKLDVNLHEAITVGPGEADVVIEEFEKGYLIGDKVIRPAKVRVGDGNTSTPA